MNGNAKAVSVASDPKNGAVVGALHSDGTFVGKVGGIGTGWVTLTSNIKAISVATDESNGPVFGALTTDGVFMVKAGSIFAPWVVMAGNVKAISVATDPVNGPVIGALHTNGVFIAKAGSISAGWATMAGNVKAISVASDPRNGAVVGALHNDGTFIGKVGGIGAGWVTLNGNAKAISVASDEKNGPLFGALHTDGVFIAKAGSISAGWVTMAGNVRAISVASDPFNGPVIGALHTNGVFIAKTGGLSSGWITMTSNVRSMAMGPESSIRVPDAPSGVVAIGGVGSATVSFVPPQFDGGSAASFVVTASPGGASATGSSSPITVSGLTPGAPHTFRVAATNAMGPGPSSPPSSLGSAVPEVSIGNASVAEGNVGNRQVRLTVSLSRASPAPTTVAYATVAGTATAGSDFTAKSGSLIIPAGVTSGMVVVPIVGDRTQESNETFTVRLTNPQGAVLRRATGTATITNDDNVTGTAARLSIGSASLVEGHAGARILRFSVVLSAPRAAPTTVQYATLVGTASTADFTPKSGTLTIPKNSNSAIVTVSTTPDTIVEPGETFKVKLSNPVGASIQFGTGTGTIINDD